MLNYEKFIEEMPNYDRFIQEMPKLSEFKLWFEWVPNGLRVIDLNTFTYTGDTILSSGAGENDPVLLENLALFQKRPEFYVGCGFKDVPQSEVSDYSALLDCRLKYELALLGCSLIRKIQKCNSFEEFCKADDMVPKFKMCIDWLESTDFFEAPASRGYHGSFTGGLLCHCLDVCNCVIGLWRSGVFMVGDAETGDLTLDSAILCALVHDWCKIGLYESYMRNVKNEDTGKWDKVPSFKYRDTPTFTFGHGTTSMYLASKFFKLMPEEALAIRWHMGRWQVGDCEESELQQSNQRHPVVYLIQFADQLSCTNYFNRTVQKYL